MGNETKHRKYNENQMQTELKPKSRLKQSSVCFFHSFVCPIRRFSVRLCVCVCVPEPIESYIKFVANYKNQVISDTSKDIYLRMQRTSLAFTGVSIEK